MVRTFKSTQQSANRKIKITLKWAGTENNSNEKAEAPIWQKLTNMRTLETNLVQ